MAMKLLCDTQRAKVEHSWTLEGKMEILKEVLDLGTATWFNHVGILGNKAANRMMNLGMETDKQVKAKEWSEIMDVKTRDSCINIKQQDMQSSNETRKEGYWVGLDH